MLIYWRVPRVPIAIPRFSQDFPRDPTAALACRLAPVWVTMAGATRDRMGEIAACRGSAEAHATATQRPRALCEVENPGKSIIFIGKIMENHGKSTISTGPWLQ